MARSSRSRSPKCSFCDNQQVKGIKIIAGPKGVHICSECIKLSLDMIRNDKPTIQMNDVNHLPTPKRNQSAPRSICDWATSGEETLSVAVYNHYKRLENVRLVEEKQEEVEIQKSNLLLIGPTGTENTDGTNVSEVPQRALRCCRCHKLKKGYVGEDVENIVLNLYVPQMRM